MPQLSRKFGRALITGGALFITGLLASCTPNQAAFFDLPEPATKEAPIIQSLWQGSWIAAWGVGIITWGLIIWSVVRYRRRNEDFIPKQTTYHLPIEIMYTVIPLVMILGLFFFTARDQTAIATNVGDQDKTINVVGFRWSWGFNYLDEDVWDVGLPAGPNITGEPPTLVLPINQKVRFELNSPDVIHSFWIPAFLFKMDVFPGKTNVFELTPDKLGTFPGKCAELCGVYHARMLFNVKVVEQAEFDQHIAALKAKGQTGLLQTGRFDSLGQVPNERVL